MEVEKYTDNKGKSWVRIKFKDAARTEVIIPEDEKSRTLMEAIETESAYNLRELQPYTCQISENERDKLLNENVIALKNGIYYLVDDGRYCKETGIIV